VLRDWGAITGRTITVSRKFALYWIQSQTTRIAARSASDRLSASTIGAIAARAPADSRSRRTARMSISTRSLPYKHWACKDWAQNDNSRRFYRGLICVSRADKFQDLPVLL
jgi:hypothetical protein